MNRFKAIFFIIVFIVPAFLFGQNIRKETTTYAVKDSQELKMDIYTPEINKTNPNKMPCLMFVFGGGFKEGSRDNKFYSDYFQYFARHGFIVVSIDYRLGMKGQKAPSPFNTKPLRNAIDLAVSDLYSATNYVLTHADVWNIDAQHILVSGSSAGAITVLQADYCERDNKPIANILPDTFHYAGVISFAGGVFSTEGLPSYTQRPAPTLFFHGSADKLVPYNNTRLFRLGMFGSKSLAKRFKKEGYPYQFYSIEGMGHSVAEYPMHEFLPEIESFIRNFVFDNKQWMIDIQFRDKLRKTDNSVNPSSYYR